MDVPGIDPDEVAKIVAIAGKRRLVFQLASPSLTELSLTYVRMSVNIQEGLQLFTTHARTFWQKWRCWPLVVWRVPPVRTASNFSYQWSCNCTKHSESTLRHYSDCPWRKRTEISLGHHVQPDYEAHPTSHPIKRYLLLGTKRQELQPNHLP